MRHRVAPSMFVRAARLRKQSNGQYPQFPLTSASPTDRLICEPTLRGDTPDIL
jgi:hypothetical protein